MRKTLPNLLFHSIGTSYGDFHEKEQPVFRNAFELRSWSLSDSTRSEFEPFWKRRYAKFDTEFQHALDGVRWYPEHARPNHSFADVAFDSAWNVGHDFR